jgi:hypothetical protein
MKEGRRNHPGDFPIQVVAALHAEYAAKLELHDFIFFAARDKQGGEFTQKRQVADDHQVATGLFKRLFGCGNLILWPEARSLYEPSPEHLGQQFPGLLRPCFATMPNGVDHKLQRTQKIPQRAAPRRFLYLLSGAADLLLRISIFRAAPNK